MPLMFHERSRNVLLLHGSKAGDDVVVGELDFSPETLRRFAGGGLMSRTIIFEDRATWRRSGSYRWVDKGR